MIDVVSVSKKYGKRYAIRDISFNIQEGEIVGLLGPNGAGKSTIMNIITGYLSPSEGKVIVDGYDMEEEPDKARKSIGYLPELAPLYQEMTVREFLTFICRLKNVTKEREKQIQRVTKIVRVDDILDRPISNLSKGYRQRVGLAQALIGDPKVLILDEPTVGLDPNQIIQMRQLIRQLGHKTTIIVSSHILSEVQAVCDRVIIIQKGTIIADGKTEELTKKLSGHTTLTLAVYGSEVAVERILSDTPGIQKHRHLETQEEGVCRYSIIPQTGEDLTVRIDLFKALAADGCPILELYKDDVSLEAVFRELTRVPREGDAAEDEK